MAAGVMGVGNVGGRRKLSAASVAVPYTRNSRSMPRARNAACARSGTAARRASPFRFMASSRQHRSRCSAAPSAFFMREQSRTTRGWMVWSRLAVSSRKKTRSRLLLLASGICSMMTVREGRFIGWLCLASLSLGRSFTLRRGVQRDSGVCNSRASSASGFRREWVSIFLP